MKVVSNNRGKDREKGKGQGKGERTGERTGASGCTHRDHSRSSEQGDKGDGQHASSAWSLHYHALLLPLFDTGWLMNEGISSSITASLLPLSRCQCLCSVFSAYSRKLFLQMLTCFVLSQMPSSLQAGKQAAHKEPAKVTSTARRISAAVAFSL